MVKILVIGDLHGRMPKIHFKDFDCIVQVGDICDDRESGKIYKALFKEENELSYSEYIKKYVGVKNLEQMEKRSLKRGNEILKFLGSFGKPLFFVPGNWDQSYGPSRIKDLDKSTYNYLKAFFDWYLGDKSNKDLIKGVQNLFDCPHKLYKKLGINFIGYGLTSAYESLEIRKEKIKDKVSKDEFKKLKLAHDKIVKKLSNVFSKRDKKFPTIFLPHTIPYNTKLDKINNKKNAAHGKHVGSSIAREMCLKYRPLLCVGGHVHEGKGKDKLGKTVLVNPGYGGNAQVLIDLNEKKGNIRKIDFYGK